MAIRKLTKLVYDRLTIVAIIEPITKNRDTRVKVKCVCGNYKDVNLYALKRGSTVSCGCFQKECVGSIKLTHGQRRRANTSSEYNAWHSMNQRCNNVLYRKYDDYGGRGIEVCERWLFSFENFFADMGKKPSPKHSLDRINNDGNYEPSNCRWATSIEQNNNQRPRLKWWEKI